MKILSFVCGTLMLFASQAVAQEAYYGGWDLTYDRQGDIDLCDSNDGSCLDLLSTPRYCGRPGVGYSTMNSYIRSNYPDYVSWYIDQSCNDQFGDFVRICVYSARGNLACSTYLENGWKW